LDLNIEVGKREGESCMMGNYHVQFGEQWKLTLLFFMVDVYYRINILNKLDLEFLNYLNFFDRNRFLKIEKNILLNIINNYFFKININLYNSFRCYSIESYNENSNNNNKNKNKKEECKVFDVSLLKSKVVSINLKVLSYDLIRCSILDPFNNRTTLCKIAKKAKGIYIFKTLDTNKTYVGSSINLYSRVISYFMPSILVKADRYVLRYFNKYGFNNVKLILYIMNESVTIKDILKLEEYYIKKLSSINSLNVETTPGSGYHKPMSEGARKILRKIRGQPFYLYDIEIKSLIFIFDSKQNAYNEINIDHRTLNNCLYNGNLYLNRFLLSLELITEFVFENLISIEELKICIKDQRFLIKSIHPKSKPIYVENIDNPSLNKKFNSIGEFARFVKGDRGTIRNYLNNSKKGLYRGKWKIKFLD